mgnify:CR=1 FL=1|tara:strand:+ start:261 stop:500 length:240 start_codon:yes stop_codon:yes gene_type:complete
MGDNEVDIQEAKALIEGEKLGLLDRIVGRLISRKFFVFLSATALLGLNYLDADTWGMIAMIYIGGQTVIDAAISWKHGK